MNFPNDITKRRFLLGHVPVALGLALSVRVVKATDSRSLYLYNLHTQERLECWYFSAGEYLPRSLVRIDKLFRDHRTGEQHRIDVNLLDTLYLLGQQLGLKDSPIEVLSGFRSESTNAMLRRHTQGVAKKSYHMFGRAVDCRFPDVSVKMLRDVAMHANRGGVGYYPRSNFVHLDTGPVRSW